MPLDSFDAAPSASAGEADRRTVRRVAAFGAAAVAATALATAGVAQGAGAGSGPSAGFGDAGTGAYAAASASPSSARASASPSASASAAAPQLRIQIAYNRVGRDLTLTFGFTGFVLEPLSTDGTKLSFASPAKRDIGLGETLAWGDGTNSDVPISGRRCPVDKEPRVVHEVKDTYQATKKYTGPGTYTVTYTYFACGLTNGKISGALTINVPK